VPVCCVAGITLDFDLAGVGVIFFYPIIKFKLNKVKDGTYPGLSMAMVALYENSCTFVLRVYTDTRGFLFFSTAAALECSGSMSCRSLTLYTSSAEHVARGRPTTAPTPKSSIWQKEGIKFFIRAIHGLGLFDIGMIGSGLS